MSTPIVDSLTCSCCSLVKLSNLGHVSSNLFICYTCSTAEKVTKQTGFIALIQAQQVIIDGALTQLLTLDALDVINTTAQLRVILDSQRSLQQYVSSN